MKTLRLGLNLRLWLTLCLNANGDVRSDADDREDA